MIVIMVIIIISDSYGIFCNLLQRGKDEDKHQLNLLFFLTIHLI